MSTAAAEPRRRTRLRVGLERALAGALLLAIGGLALTALASRLGWLDELAERGIARALGTGALEIELRGVRVSPWASTVTLRDLSVRARATPGGQPLAHLERITLRLRSLGGLLGERPTSALGVEVDGGFVQVGRRAERAWAEAFENRTARAEPGEPFDPRRVPALAVRGLELDALAEFGWRGELDARFEAASRRLDGSLALETVPAELGRLEWFGSMDEAGRVELLARGQRFDLAPFAESLPAGLQLSCRGEAELAARFDPAGSERPLGALVRVRGDELTAVFPPPAGGAGWRAVLERAELEAVFHPAGVGRWLEPDAWSARARLEGTASSADELPLPQLEVPFEMAAELFGAAQPGELARATLRCPDLSVGPNLTDRLQATLATLELEAVREPVAGVVTALEPRGAGDLRVGATWPADAELRSAPRTWIAYDPGGRTGITYRGFRDRKGVRHGFPLPADRATGLFCVSIDPRRAPSFALGLVGLAAETTQGPIECDGYLARRPPARRETKRGIDVALHLSTTGLDVGPEVTRAVEGLDVGFDLEQTVAPRAGRAAATVRIDDRHPEPGPRISVDVEFLGAAGRYAPVPVPFEDAAGRLALRWSADSRRDEEALRRPFGLAVEATGSLPDAPNARVGALASVRQADLEGTPVDFRRGREGIAAVVVDWSDVPIESSVLGELASTSEELEALDRARADARLEGGVRGRFVRVRHAPEAAFEERIEASAADLSLALAEPRVAIDAIAGRTLVLRSEDLAPDPEEPRPAPSLAGQFRGADEDGTALALTLARRGDGVHVDAYADGLSLDGPLAPRGPEAAGTQAVSDLDVRGRLDVRVSTTLDGAFAPSDELRLEARLRANELEVGEVRLEGLSGRIVREPGGVRAALVEARHARTPFVVRDLRVDSDPESGTTDVQGQLWLEDLPLDRTHVAPLIGHEVFDTVVERSRWRGSLDVRGARFRALYGPDRTPRLELAGEFVPHDLFAQVGLPLQVSSARVVLERLVAEGSDVRTFGSVSELYGTVAGRSLADLETIVSYTAGRLTLSDLSGEFAGGRVRSLGSGMRGATTLAVEWKPPYRFELGFGLERVSMAELFEGLFQSDVADRGELHMDVQLAGRRGDVLGLTGRGSIEILGARLYSLPVVRELFALLGFDTTATFDGMSTRFSLADGVIRLTDAEAHSPLVKLVGGGTLDLNGTLDQEYTLTYSLVDRLGLLSRILYWFQNRLLRVDISGDMGRPRVRITNVLFDLVGSAPTGPRLPLARRPPLGDRF